MTVQVKIVRTIVGWFNLYNVATSECTTVSPDKFAELFPSMSPKLKLGCGEISQAHASELFKEVKAA